MMTAATDLPMLALVAVLGLMAGSFLNVVIHRLPIMMGREDEGGGEGAAAYNLAVPGSRCPACGVRIRPIHNIPLLGYLILRGRCANCRATISWRYPVVECLGAAAALTLALRFGLSAAFVAATLFAWVGIAIAFIDAEHMVIPDRLALPLLWVGLLVNSGGLFVSPRDAILGAALGYCVFAVFHWGGAWLLKRDTLGRGDLKMFAAIGAWVGWTALPLVLFLASLLGSVTGLLCLWRRRSASGLVPFGPFLTVAGLVALGWGTNISRFYWNFWNV